MFNYKNKTYYLDVYLNTKLLLSGFTVTTFSLSGKPQTKKLDDQVSLKKNSVITLLFLTIQFKILTGG